MSTPTAANADDYPQLLSQTQLATYLGLSPSTIWRKYKKGELPKCVIENPRAKRWSRATIDRWLRTGDIAAPVDSE